MAGFCHRCCSIEPPSASLSAWISGSHWTLVDGLTTDGTTIERALSRSNIILVPSMSSFCSFKFLQYISAFTASSRGRISKATSCAYYKTQCAWFGRKCLLEIYFVRWWFIPWSMVLIAVQREQKIWFKNLKSDWFCASTSPFLVLSRSNLKDA